MKFYSLAKIDSIVSVKTAQSFSKEKSLNKRAIEAQSRRATKQTTSPHSPHNDPQGTPLAVFMKLPTCYLVKLVTRSRRRLSFKGNDSTITWDGSDWSIVTGPWRTGNLELFYCKRCYVRIISILYRMAHFRVRKMWPCGKLYFICIVC